jgi:transcriptional regulator
VPTWNYSVVHAYGTATLLEDPVRVRALLDQTVHTFDTHGWSTASVSEQYIANMARGIVAFEIPITRLEGKRKLGQNRPVMDVDGAISGLRAVGDVESLAVADDMQAAAESRR